MKRRLKTAWQKFLVFFGFRYWAKMQYNRPSFARCAYHGQMMKRGAKTEFGAFYYCPLCRRAYHLQSKGNKLIPV